MFRDDLTWKCDVCGRIRQDAAISVFKQDHSSEYNMPTGSLIYNIKYCNDTPRCIEEAPNARLKGRE